ncbi:MAG: 1-(5-phosphoribosyl)-5-[(5-phosphoribosylamino)methylideneamino]imidazole-4-carboxamide isomerase [Chlamydiota bacterium]|nr:1-(5-phosphoribosyl)-5-[(5-phosphoribosylamino)methylideneamino]imidazole-4-carboxamide isomerase [Chlamydiota bacterium]
MIILPAIDIKDGKCVRLHQGKKEEETVYAEDPTPVALKWQNKGAQYLHIVDLDAAFEGRLVNFDVIRNMTMDLTIPFQYAGGLRSLESIERSLSLGADRVVIGTVACESEDFLENIIKEFKQRIAVAIDVREGVVSVKGWTQDTGIEPIYLAKQVEKMGGSMIVYTDILSDGAMKGPNFKGVEMLLDAIKVPVIVSGGISSVEDVKKIKKIEYKGVAGVIIGKALYTGDIKLEQVLYKS